MDETLRTITMDWREGLQFVGGPAGIPPVTIDGDVGVAPGPMHALLMAVAGCMGADVVSILIKMQVGLRTCRIEVTGRRAIEHPKRYTEIRLVVSLAGDGLDDAKARRAIDLSLEKYCSVVHSLKLDVPITYELHLG